MARTKKEFSKEAMYKKIMPSMLKNTDEDETITSHEIDNNIYIQDEFEGNTTVGDDDGKNFDISSTIDTQDDITDNIFIEENPVDLVENQTVNLVEMLVQDKLDAVLSRFKCCKCESCKNDIIVIALNSLPTYYYSGTKNEIDVSLNEFKLNNNIDVVSEIIKAIISVRKKEKH